MTRRAAIYTRLSKDRPEERSREDQEKDCRSLLSAKGYDAVATFTDLESGYRRNVQRPGYAALLDAVAAGEFNAVAVWKLDRLTRQGIRQLAPLLDTLEATGTTLLSVHDPVDTSSAMGEGVLGMIASMAKAESENISLRSSRAKRHHAEAGRHKDGGPRAFGLTRDWSSVVPEESALIKEAADRILRGESLRAIILDWRSRGVRTTTGRPFGMASLRSLLRQERLHGARVYNGRVVATGNWPVLLDEATARRVRAILDDPSRRSGAPIRSYLLTGFLRCSKCGGRMRSTAPAKGKRRYACPPKPEGCNGTTILADRVEEEVAAQVFVAIDSPGLSEAFEAGDCGEELVAAITEDEAQLEELAGDWAAKRITRTEWLVARDAVQSRLDDTRARLAENAMQSPVRFADLPGRWEELTFDQRRAVLSAVLERVEVRPATRGRQFFDPSRLHVVWRA